MQDTTTDSFHSDSAVVERRSAAGWRLEPFRVERFRIASTDIVVHVAWEELAGHATTKSDEGGWLGKVGTRPLPDSIEQLEPGSRERSAAVSKHHSDQYEEAYEALEAAYPYLREHGRRDGMGQVECSLTEAGLS